jgi:hypothetical protein
VSVHNVATKENGDLDVIDGSAYVPDENFPGELKVEFPGSKSIFKQIDPKNKFFRPCWGLLDHRDRLSQLFCGLLLCRLFIWCYQAGVCLDIVKRKEFGS